MLFWTQGLSFGGAPMAFLKKATATLFVIAILGISLAVTPKDASVLTSCFIYGSLLFTLIFAIQQLAAKGTGRDKALMVLLSPLVGMAVTAVLGALFVFWRFFVGLALLGILWITVSGLWQYAHRDLRR